MPLIQKPLAGVFRMLFSALSLHHEAFMPFPISTAVCLSFKENLPKPFVASNGLLALATIWPGMAGTPAAAFLLAKTAVANASCQNPTLVLADAKVSVAHCCTIFLGHLVLKYMIKSVRMLVSRLVSLPRLDL